MSIENRIVPAADSHDSRRRPQSISRRKKSGSPRRPVRTAPRRSSLSNSLRKGQNVDVPIDLSAASNSPTNVTGVERNPCISNRVKSDSAAVESDEQQDQEGKAELRRRRRSTGNLRPQPTRAGSLRLQPMIASGRTGRRLRNNNDQTASSEESGSTGPRSSETRTPGRRKSPGRMHNMTVAKRDSNSMEPRPSNRRRSPGRMSNMAIVKRESDIKEPQSSEVRSSTSRRKSPGRMSNMAAVKRDSDGTETQSSEIRSSTCRRKSPGRMQGRTTVARGDTDGTETQSWTRTPSRRKSPGRMQSRALARKNTDGTESQSSEMRTPNRRKSPGRMQSLTTSPQETTTAAPSPKRKSPRRNSPRRGGNSPRKSTTKRSSRWAEMNDRVKQLGETTAAKPPVVVSASGNITESQRHLGAARPSLRPSTGGRQESVQLKGLLQKLRDPSQRNLMAGYESEEEEEKKCVDSVDLKTRHVNADRVSSRNLMRFMKPTRKAYGYQQDLDNGQ